MIKPDSVPEQPKHQLRGQTTEFRINNIYGHFTATQDGDGKLVQLDIEVGKTGAQRHGDLSAVATAVSLALQAGVPLVSLVKEFRGVIYWPHGYTNDPDIPFAASVLDYIFRRLALDFIPLETRRFLSILSASERGETVLTNMPPADTPICYTCGVGMMRSGTTLLCPTCGTPERGHY